MSTPHPRCWGIVPAAGIGARMESAEPKQYLEIDGSTVLEHSLGCLLASDQVSGVVVALHAQDRRAKNLPLVQDARVHTVVGADQRSGSVLAALESLSGRADGQDWVLVHDAARPCLALDDMERLIALVRRSNCGGILAEPIVDTVKQAGDDDRVVATLDRSTLWRAQTPQMFRLEELRTALHDALAQGRSITDEASAMELAGHPVQLVPGSRDNLKITVPADLELARWILQQRNAR